MRYGVRLPAEIGIGILVVLLIGLCGVGKTIPKGVIPTPPGGPIAVKITTDRMTYAPGDTIKITIAVDKRCYLYLYDIDPADTVTLLFPNRFQPDPRVPPGKLALPGKGYRFVVGGPEGLETLVAVAAEAPIPALKLDKEKEAFRSFKLTPSAFAEKLKSSLPKNGYTTAWTQITVYQPKGTLLIDSDPEGAEIYANGHYVGKTPKAITIPAARTTITLKKAGFIPYSKTIELTDKTVAEISARLEQAPLQPPTGGETALPGFLFLDIGRTSLAGEFGITRTIGMYVGARFLDDRALDGPEWELGLRAHIPTTENVRVILGGGIGAQERYLVPPAGETIPQRISIESEIKTVIFPDVMLGLELDLQYGLLFGGYDLRRGPILGIGISFGNK